MTAEAAASPALRAMCDVLMLRALESVGKRILKGSRSRHQVLARRSPLIAHTLWDMPDEEVSKALRGTWSCIGELLRCHNIDVDPSELSALLDSLVRDLVATGTLYTLEELDYRLATRLSSPAAEDEQESWTWDEVPA